MMEKTLKAIYKYFQSYNKKTWEFEDYPIRYKKARSVPGHYNIGELKLWQVQIINWWVMSGVGDTKEEAYQMLKNDFNNYKQHFDLPRPGTKVPLQYADTSIIDNLEDIAKNFVEKVLDVNYNECFISNESYLETFGCHDDETLEKINSLYNLGLTDLGDGNISRLLLLIKDKKSIL